MAASVCRGQSLPDEVIVSYTAAKKPLPTVLDELADRSGVNIVYSANRLPRRRTVTIQAQNERLGSLLTVILSKFKYTYKIVGGQIVIVRDDYRNVEQDITISGYVRDSLSGEPLVLASIFLYDQSKGTETNEYGFFSFTLPKGNQRVYFSYLGYEQKAINYRIKKDSSLIVELVPDLQLNEIIILEDDDIEANQNTIDEERVNFDQMQSMASLGGEADIVRLGNMMPGVSSGSDGLGGLNVRGGSADQNLVLLDGVPLYNVGHALGLFSVFNSNVIKSASLIKGGIPARYGGRLSSVLDVRTREGNTKQMAGSVSMSLIALKASLEGPIGSGGSSYLVTARRTFADPWLKAVSQYQNELNDNEGETNYFFYDLNAKLNFQLGKRNKIMLSSYAGKDDFTRDVTSFRTEPVKVKELDDVKWNWGNRMSILRFNSQLSTKLFAKASAYYTEFDFSSFDHNRYETELSIDSTSLIYQAKSYVSNINDIGLKLDFDYVPTPIHFIKFGLGAIQHEFDPGLTAVTQKDGLVGLDQALQKEQVEALIDRPKLNGNELSVYVEDQMTFNYHTMLNVGVHASYITADNNSYISIQPRISTMLRTDALYWKGSWSRMNQYLHLISNNGLGLPAEVWLPSTDRLRPQECDIFSSKVGYYIKGGMQIGAEAYYKLFRDLSTFNEGAAIDINVGSDWQSKVPVGSGKAYGLEFFFNKESGKTTWMSNYTFGRSTRLFNQLNNGREYNHKFSLDHSAKFSFRHRLTDNAEFTLNYLYSTGARVTTPSGVILEGPDGELRIDYPEKNNEVLRAYQRLDIGFNFYSKFKWGRQKISLGAYNVLNKKNVFFVDIERNEFDSEKYDLKEYSILPIFPVIAYSLSF